MTISVQSVPNSYQMVGVSNLTTQERLSRAAAPLLSSLSSPSTVVTLGNSLIAPLVYNAAGLVQTSLQNNEASRQSPQVLSASQLATLAATVTPATLATPATTTTPITVATPVTTATPTTVATPVATATTTAETTTDLAAIDLTATTVLTPAKSVTTSTMATRATVATPAITVTPATTVTTVVTATPTIAVTPATTTISLPTTNNAAAPLQTSLADATPQAITVTDPAYATYAAAAEAYYLSVNAYSSGLNRERGALPNRDHQVQPVVMPLRIPALSASPHRTA
jgi:hypothetical protein